MAKQLIENLTAEWDPDEYHDEYREALLEIVEKKIAGEEIEVAPEEEPARVVDLMEALKASVAAAKSGEPAEPATGPERSAAKAKSAAKKASGKKRTSAKTPVKKQASKKSTAARKKAVGE